MTRPLEGEIALITGASRGLGSAMALRLAKDGANIIVHYGGSRDAAEETAKAVEAEGRTAHLVQADLAAPDGAEKLAGAAREALDGRKLDILVHNAGIADYASLEEQDVAGFDRMFAVNVRAPFFTTQHLLPTLAENARIVFVSSIVATSSFPGIPAYSMTKGAIDTAVVHLANELGPRGIRVNAVAPGAILTDMADWLNSEEGRDNALSMQALKRVGQPEDIAGTVAFLAGPDSAWVTGQTVQTGGGSKL